MALTNGLFIQRSFADQIQRTFLETLAGQYGARPYEVDFSGGEAAATIDAWVSAQTRKRISKLFDSIGPDMKLVLANAVYLKAAWFHAFDASQTKLGPFTTGTGKAVTARVMSQLLQEVAYSSTPQWQRLSLPYVGGELTMRIVLPADTMTTIDALGRLVPVATAPKLTDPPSLIKLTLPKWDTGTDLDLLPQLHTLGLSDLDDLAGISGGLSVSQAVHRANITVDELGTEAAAVTGIEIPSSLMAGPTHTMSVNRPFVWAVVHEPTGAVLFAGHVVDPT